MLRIALVEQALELPEAAHAIKQGVANEHDMIVRLKLQRHLGLNQGGCEDEEKGEEYPMHHSATEPGKAVSQFASQAAHTIAGRTCNWQPLLSCLSEIAALTRTRPMKRSVLISLVAILAVTATIAGVFLAQPNPMAPRVKQLELDLSKANNEITRLKTEYDKLLAAKKPAPTIAHGNAPATKPLTASAASQAAPASSGDALRKMMEAPGMKEMMRKQQEVQIDMTYGKLFQQLGLSDKELDNFKQLLADRQLKQTEVGMKMMDSSLTTEQRGAIANEMTAAKKDSDAAIRKFLNNEDDFKTFQQWDDTQPERMQMQLAASNFDSAGAPLSEEQRNQLIDLMAAVRKAPSQTPDLNDPRNITPGSLSPDGIAQQLARYDADAQRVLQQAANFLSPAQLDALKRMQQQMRTMAEAGMRMSGSMFAPPKK